MFYCPECRFEFKTAKRLTETHGLSSPPFEEFFVCPRCKGTSFYQKNTTHCRCCGRKLNGTEEYCAKECRERGELLWRKEQKSRDLRLKSPLNQLVSELESYNLKNGTSYSYGEYVAFIKPRIKKRSRHA